MGPFNHHRRLPRSLPPNPVAAFPNVFSPHHFLFLCLASQNFYVWSKICFIDGGDYGIGIPRIRRGMTHYTSPRKEGGSVQRHSGELCFSICSKPRSKRLQRLRHPLPRYDHRVFFFTRQRQTKSSHPTRYQQTVPPAVNTRVYTLSILFRCLPACLLSLLPCLFLF